MSAIHDTSPHQLAELIMIAGSKLADEDRVSGALVPTGIPVRRGRLYLGRLRTLLDSSERPSLGVRFATACWIGPAGGSMPNLGQLRYAATIDVDPRGRLVLDRRVRSWLAVDTPMCFDVITAPASEGGVLVVPVDGFAQRWQAISS
ncbi:MAG: hypothetical protein JWM34_3733 [Ilumatobacteraceae bacterium]|nr:hypothetical protein [Ilumatobacteraceae bacterium]